MCGFFRRLVLGGPGFILNQACFELDPGRVYLDDQARFHLVDQARFHLDDQAGDDLDGQARYVNDRHQDLDVRVLDPLVGHRHPVGPVRRYQLLGRDGLREPVHLPRPQPL